MDKPEKRPPSAAAVPRYVTMKEALRRVAEHFSTSERTLRRNNIHHLLGKYALGYARGKRGIIRVPEDAIEEVIEMMHHSRII